MTNDVPPLNIKLNPLFTKLSTKCNAPIVFSSSCMSAEAFSFFNSFIDCSSNSLFFICSTTSSIPPYISSNTFNFFIKFLYCSKFTLSLA